MQQVITNQPIARLAAESIARRIRGAVRYERRSGNEMLYHVLAEGWTDHAVATYRNCQRFPPRLSETPTTPETRP